MKQLVLMFLLLWSSGPHLASAVYVHSPEEVVVDTGTTDTGSHLTSAVYVRSPEEVVVGNGTTDAVCGVPAIKPVVPGCRSYGLGIINGTEAIPHSWPWQVSLKTCCDPPFCGGTLINKDWVVTAAHCEVRTCHRVMLGQHSLKRADDIQDMTIGKVFDHPEYNEETYDYDIALIKLKSPAQMNENVSPVCVAETGVNLTAGMKCVATGWGRTRYRPANLPDKLQQICVPLIGFKECSSDWYKGEITSQMLCAGAAGADTCKGDSGGPLVCKKNGAWTLVGVTSWGSDGCPTKMPGVYSRITVLRAWMDQIMANN